MKVRAAKHAGSVSSTAPVVVLHQAQIGENIGMSARAMANCGLSELRLSCPRAGWDQEKARAAATCGVSIIDQHQQYDDLLEALADCHRVYATTARPRDMAMAVITPEQAAAEILALPHNSRTALLFGAEASGLSNHDISLTQAIIEIPLHEKCRSLNLSQAVLLCAYAYRQQAHQTQQSQATPHSIEMASHQEVQFWIDRLEQQLEQRSFFREPNLALTTKRNIRTMFHRPCWSKQEIQTLQGILRSLAQQK